MVHIPMHQYARYFERYRAMAASRPLIELAPEKELAQFREDTLAESGPKQKSDRDAEQQMRGRIDSFHLEVFHRTQTETTKRWTYESEVKRPYYHVTDLDEQQLVNWRKYLDFEEAEGDYTRTKFLYERCLVTAANYEEFWLRYARWMFAQQEKQEEDRKQQKQEEVRNIYSRASCVYVPMSNPTVRLHYAQFEEAVGRSDVAVAIHEAILMNMPSHVETIISTANVHRRQYGLASAIDVLEKYINSEECDVDTRGALVSEWARLVWKVQGDVDEARKIYQGNQQFYLDCHAFWINWLEFEMQQPTSESEEPERYSLVKAVFDDIRRKSRLSTELVKEVSAIYFVFLKERGGKDAMKEYMILDREINGPLSVMSDMEGMLAEVGTDSTMQRPLMREHSKPDVEMIEPSIQSGDNLPTKYHAQQGKPLNGDQFARVSNEA